LHQLIPLDDVNNLDQQRLHLLKLRMVDVFLHFLLFQHLDLKLVHIDSLVLILSGFFWPDALLKVHFQLLNLRQQF